MEPELIIRFKGDTKDLDTQLEKLKTSLGELEPATNKAAKGNKKLDDSNNNLVSSVGKLAAGYLTLQAALSAGKFVLDATLQVSKFETQLKTASGSQEKFGSNMQFLEGLANTYKKNVVDLGASFAQLTIATKGTNLEGAETEKLFKAVTVASSALKMSTDDTNGTFRAFIQMVSKGNVQAEELRGQLGERLYGAFGLAAKAMGVTTSELNKMLERGEVLASDLLPKMADGLLDTFGKDAVNGAQTLGSNIDYASGQLTLFVAELAKTTGMEGALNALVSSFGSMLSTLRTLNKESGIVNGFFDRMFTLPGNKLTTRGSNNFETFDQKINKQSANLYKGINTPFSGTQSTTSTEGYGQQFDIRDANPAAEEKIRKQNEAALRKRQAYQNKLDSDAKKDNKQRIDDLLAQSESDIEKSYAKYNGTLGAIAQIDSKGITTGLNNALEPIKKFTKEVTGDGKTIDAFAKLGESISTTKGLFTNAQAEMATSVSGAQEQLKSELISDYGSLEAATKAGMGKFVQAATDGSMSYKQVINNLKEFRGVQDLAQNIQGALRNAAGNTAESFGEMVGSALAGGEGFEDAGKKFGLILAKLLQDIGKAMIAFATLKIAASNFKINPYVALAAGIAAVAAGAVLKNKLSDTASQGLYTGGIVQGRAGVDTVETRLTPGELVLTKRQQQNMFSLINSSSNGRNSNKNFASSGGDANITGQLVGRLRGSDIDIAARLGSKTNNKFR